MKFSVGVLVEISIENFPKKEQVLSQLSDLLEFKFIAMCCTFSCIVKLPPPFFILLFSLLCENVKIIAKESFSLSNEGMRKFLPNEAKHDNYFCARHFTILLSAAAAMMSISECIRTIGDDNSGEFQYFLHRNDYPP
jgi:hypothetical protein